jgi:hypothetical protein
MRQRLNSPPNRLPNDGTEGRHVLIRFSLKCPEGHVFESWFQSGAAFDGLAASGRVSCPVCGTVQVEKTLMTPGVTTKSNRQDGASPPAETPSGLTTKDTAMEQELKAFRAHVEANSDYVGRNFASEARKIHLGDAPERAIFGEANLTEARALIEDGIPIAPLPFLPKLKAH